MKLHGFLERTAFSKTVMFSTSQAPLTDRQTLNFKLTRYLFALQRFSTVKLEKEGTNIQNIKVKNKTKQHTCTLYDYYIKYFIRYNILTPFLLLLEARHSLSFLKKKKINILFYVLNPFFDKIYILMVCFKISIKKVLDLFHTCF